ncbi:MAG: 6-bladed beta-propeller [Candidatus Nitrospinota bacterium M3_3B_026]
MDNQGEEIGPGDAQGIGANLLWRWIMVSEGEKTVFKNRVRKRGRAWLAAAAALLLLSGACATYEERDVAVIPSWPPPPDPPRFVYETTLRSDLSVKEETTESRFKEFASKHKKPPKVTLVKPFDVAARKGRIIVSDTVMRIVYLFDVPRRSVFVFGRMEEGELAKPAGVDIDDELNFYVADVTAKVVKVYDPVGHFSREIGEGEELVRPTDVAVSPNGERIYVVDMGGVESMSHRIVVFNKKGEKISVIGERGLGDGQFNLPTHAAVGPGGKLYVLDSGNFRVQVFGPEGEFISAFGEVGSGYGNLARPRGLGVDQEGNVYITDAAFRNFQIFDEQGRLLMFIGGGPGREDGPGKYVLPAGITVDETNRVYIVDQFFKKVDVIRRLSDEESEKLAKERM